jgi:signal transduction histidine kinase
MPGAPVRRMGERGLRRRAAARGRLRPYAAIVHEPQDRDRLLDLMIALAMAVAAVGSVLTKSPSTGYVQPEPNVWLALLAAIAGLSLAQRRRWPLGVLLVTVAADTAIEWHGWNPNLVKVCVLFALYGVAAWRSPKLSGACVVGLYAVQAVVYYVPAPPSSREQVSPETFIYVGVWVLGLVVRRWRLGRAEALERAMTTERTRAAAVERAVFAERRRIVGELHDVVTHTLSVITVQSSVARHLVGTRPQDAAPALAVIESASRAALDDLRRMLGLLRAGPRTQEEAPASPDPVRVHPLDLVFGAAMAAVSVSSVLTTDPTDAYSYPDPDLRLALFALVSGFALAWCRRWPATVLAVVLGSVGLVSGLGWNAGGTPVCLAIALYAVASWQDRRRAVGGLLAVYAVMGVLALVRAPYFDSPFAFVSVVAFSTVWVIGRFSRNRRLGLQAAVARALAAERDRAVAAERAVVEERLRVARDLHDVVSHTLSVIAVQAGVAGYVVDDRPEQVLPALQIIEDSSRRALADLRHLSDVLDTDTEAALAPVPGLAELELLASTHRVTDGPVSLSVDAAVAEEPDSLRATVYRLVQEALTNVRKHASGAPVTVEVRAADGRVEVRVENGGPVVSATSGRSGDPGFGLVGMRERVALFDGTIDAGPTADSGFRVHAVLHSRIRDGAGV